MVPNFDRSTVKHARQNIEMIATSGYLAALECTILYSLYLLLKKGRFYRAMHFSAKRGIAIACRLSVCLSVCNVGEL